MPYYEIFRCAIRHAKDARELKEVYTSRRVDVDKDERRNILRSLVDKPGYDPTRCHVCNVTTHGQYRIIIVISALTNAKAALEAKQKVQTAQQMLVQFIDGRQKGDVKRTPQKTS